MVSSFRTIYIALVAVAQDLATRLVVGASDLIDQRVQVPGSVL